MTLSTSTVTLAPGSSRTYSLAPGEAVTVATEPNCYVTVTETPDVISSADLDGQTNVRTSILQYKGEWTYGPYALGGTVVVDVSSTKSTSSVSATLGSSAAAVVGAAGVVSTVPSDILIGPSTTTTGDGISAFTPYQIAAPGTYHKVRIYWRNISASADRVLYIAANAPNATRGLKQSQDARRRDASMVFGDHLMLISAEPVTSLVFSSDGSISVNTHNLMISWGN